MGAFIISPLPPLLSEKSQNSRAASLHGHYSASALLPAHPPPSRRRQISRCCRLYRLPSFRHFRGGTRRASPVARCVLAAVPSLTTPPEWIAASIGLRRTMLPSPLRLRARPPGLRTFGATTRSLPLRPGDSLPSRGWGCRWVSGHSVSLLPAIPATGLPTFAPAGLAPAEHISLFLDTQPYVRR